MKQYIEREELVSRIYKYVELTNPDEQEWVKDECIRQAHAMPSVNVSEWISVEERLPDCEQGAESEAVLFITKQGFMFTGYYGCGGIFHDRYFREFKNATEGYDISNITHWMPLPEPPKKREPDCRDCKYFLGCECFGTPCCDLTKAENQDGGNSGG